MNTGCYLGPTPKALNSYESIAGATPAFLSSRPATDISGTDVLFGSGNERHPKLIVSERARSLFEKEKFKDIAFTEVRL